MHFAFIPYGTRQEVELLLRNMEAQKHKMKVWKGSEIKEQWIQGAIRVLPFGAYEYIFPREDMDCVLHTLIDEKNRYDFPEIFYKAFRKALKLEKIPQFKTDKQYLWIKENVNVIPLGIRKDTNIVDDIGKLNGWTHEAL